MSPFTPTQNLYGLLRVHFSTSLSGTKCSETIPRVDNEDIHSIQSPNQETTSTMFTVNRFRQTSRGESGMNMI